MTDSILTYDELLGQGPWRTWGDIVLASGNTVSRGQVIARSSATDKLVPYDSGGSNDADVPYGIAVEDVDASSGDTRCPIYVAGGFKTGGLVFGTSGDSATRTVRDTFRGIGIYIDTAVSA